MPTITTPESPQDAIGAYLDLGSSIHIGDIPHEQLALWRGAVHAAKLPPEQRMHAGWISVDYAWSLQQAYPDQTEMCQQTPPVIRDAELQFDAVVKDKAASRLLKMQAVVARAGLGAHHALTTGLSDQYEATYAASSKAYARVAEQALAEYVKDDGDLSYIPFLNSLTMIMLCHSLPHKSVYAVPPPSRASYAPEGQSSWGLIIADGRKNDLYPLRLAEPGPNPMLECFSPVGFDNAGYPSRHGRGLLQALLDRHKKLPHHEYKRNRLLSYGPADEHVKATGNRIIDELRGRGENRAERRAAFYQSLEAPLAPAVTDNPVGTYNSIEPTRYAGQLDERELEAMISVLELQLRGKQLSADQKQAFGWIQLESAIEAQLSTRPKIAIEGQFDRAEDIMGRAADSFRREKDLPRMFAARFDQASFALYRAMALAVDESVMDTARETYVADLLAIANDILTARAEASDVSLFPRDIAQTAHEIAACLSVIDGSGGSLLAGSSARRQRSRRGNDVGWDVTLWPLAKDGYRLDYYGKIRIDAEVDPLAIDKGMVALAKDDFDTDRSFGTLWNLAAKMQGLDIEPEAQAYLDWLFKRLSGAADLIV